MWGRDCFITADTKKTSINTKNMENQTKEELLEQIKKNEAKMKLIQEQIKENNRLIRQNRKAVYLNLLKIAKAKFLIFWFKLWFYIKQPLKAPGYLLFILISSIICIWDNNLRSLLKNMYNGLYTQEELVIIYEQFGVYITHLTYIFYIIVLSIFAFA